MTNALVVLDEVHQKLTAITTVEEAKEFRDRVAAIQHFAKQQRLGLETQNQAAVVKFQCERRGGELLLQVPKVQGQHAAGGGLVLTVKRSGLSTQTAYRWMALAKMPAEELLTAATRRGAEGKELTSTWLYDEVVRRWNARHVPEAERLEPVDFIAADLIEWGALAANDLDGLSDTDVAMVVREARAFYDDYCFDPERGRSPIDEGRSGIACSPAFMARLTHWAVEHLRQLKRTAARARTKDDAEQFEIDKAEVALARAYASGYRRWLRPPPYNRPPRKGRKAKWEVAPASDLAWDEAAETGVEVGQPTPLITPFDAYRQLAKRFIVETQALLTTPHGLLDEWVALDDEARGTLHELRDEVRAALDRLIDDADHQTPHDGDASTASGVD